MEAPPADASRSGDVRTFVLFVGPVAVRRLELPAEIAPERLTEPEDRAVRLQASTVRVRRWRGESLEVESEGHGWFGEPGRPGSTSLSLRYRIRLGVSEAGVRELERRRITYAKTPRD